MSSRSLWGAAALGGALLLFSHCARHEAADPEKETQHITVENGEPTIEIDEKTQQKIGLVTTPVGETQQTEQLQLFGNVVDVQELAALQNQVASARAQVAQASSKAQFDRAELARLRTLNADNKAVSDKAVQEAAAALAGDSASAASAGAALEAARTSATQRFGASIAAAMTEGSALYRALVTLQSVLVQISFPPGATVPRTLSIATGDGGAVDARLVSSAPRVDPKLQGASYFYIAPAGRLAAGMNVVTQYAGPRASRGVLVPRDAVISWQGKSWLYYRRDATHFSRREISTATPSSQGFFVTNVVAGTGVVTTGAQQLLSDEMRSQLGE